MEKIKKRKIKELNEIIIRYNIKNMMSIRLFGKKFIKNNKKNCRMVLENKEQEIFEFLYINDTLKEKENEILEIKLKEIQTITNISFMFSNCLSLISLPDISKWNTQNVIDMNSIFYYCESLTSLPDISAWNTQNVNDMGFMFSNCLSLISLPDISKWNTQNITNMSGIFKECTSLTTLPDICKWTIKNGNVIIDILSGCISLPYKYLLNFKN